MAEIKKSEETGAEAMITEASQNGVASPHDNNDRKPVSATCCSGCGCSKEQAADNALKQNKASTPLQRCSRCKSERHLYCSDDCQRAHWVVHKQTCFVHNCTVWDVLLDKQMRKRIATFLRLHPIHDAVQLRTQFATMTDFATNKWKFCGRIPKEFHAARDKLYMTSVMKYGVAPFMALTLHQPADPQKRWFLPYGAPIYELPTADSLSVVATLLSLVRATRGNPAQRIPVSEMGAGIGLWSQLLRSQKDNQNGAMLQDHFDFTAYDDRSEERMKESDQWQQCSVWDARFERFVDTRPLSYQPRLTKHAKHILFVSWAPPAWDVMKQLEVLDAKQVVQTIVAIGPFAPTNTIHFGRPAGPYSCKNVHYYDWKSKTAERKDAGEFKVMTFHVASMGCADSFCMEHELHKGDESVFCPAEVNNSVVTIVTKELKHVPECLRDRWMEGDDVDGAGAGVVG